MLDLGGACHPSPAEQQPDSTRVRRPNRTGLPYTVARMSLRSAMAHRNLPIGDPGGLRNFLIQLLVLGVGTFALGASVFNRLSPRFAEEM